MNIVIDKSLRFDMQALGETIKAIRIRKKMTQAEFAQNLVDISGVDISRVKVSRWEDGKNEPSASEVVAIAQFADCSVDELLGLGVVAAIGNGGGIDAELIERIAQATAQQVIQKLSQQVVENLPKPGINVEPYTQLHLDIQMNEWGNERVLRRVQALIKASLEKRGLAKQPGKAAEEAGIDPSSFDRSALRAFESGSIERMRETSMTPGLERAIAAICYEVVKGWDASHNPLALAPTTYKDNPEQLLRDLLNHQYHGG